MNDIKSLQDYAQAITEKYNEHARALENRESLGLFEEGFHAFMCNSITMAVCKSQHQEVKDYFYAYAEY